MRIPLILLICLFSLTIHSQNFSGEIEYEIEIFPKNENVNVDSIWNLKHGKTAKYRITESYYKSTYFSKGEITYSYTYDNVSKRMYDNYAERDYITYRDSRRANYKYYDSKIYRDSTEQLLGMDCFMVTYDSDYGKTKSYYSDKVRVNYSTFEDHKVGNWYEKLKAVDGSLPIKTITEFEDYIEVQKAVKITQLDLDKSDFQLPGDKLIAASYLALDKRVQLKQPTESQVELYLSFIQRGLNIRSPEEKFTSYVSFIVTSEGEIQHVKAVEEDPWGLFNIAEEAIRKSGFKFIPGKIGGKNVSSLAYFPVEFSKQL